MTQPPRRHPHLTPRVTAAECDGANAEAALRPLVRLLADAVLDEHTHARPAACARAALADAQSRAGRPIGPAPASLPSAREARP